MLCDIHHSQLFQSFIYLFEKRLGMKVYRPCGEDWYRRGYYFHPIEAEALANLTKGSETTGELVPQAESPFWWKLDNDASYFSQDNQKYRWLPLERVKEVDYIVCSTDRTQYGFKKLRDEHGLKAKIIRYVGNREEGIDPSTFDIFIPATLRYFNEFKDSKPSVLYHPEFDLELYSFKRLPTAPLVRTFLNFIVHHRGPGSPWEVWQRYVGYGNEFGVRSYTHGLGTPPPGIEVEMDVIIDTCFDRMGRPELKDRSTWPDLRCNQGEPSSHKQIAQLMQLSNLVVHPKRGSEGYGFVIHALAACGRPPIVERDWYAELSAFRFLQHRETCLFITGNDPVDKANYRWALENNERMSRTLYQRFMSNVDFDLEAKAIANLL